MENVRHDWCHGSYQGRNWWGHDFKHGKIIDGKRKDPPAGIVHTLRNLYFQFLSNWMGYDHGDSFPFDYGPNGILFGSKSKGKLSPWSYPI